MLALLDLFNHVFGIFERDLECRNMRLKRAIELVLLQVVQAFLKLLVWEVGNDDDFGTKLLSVLHLGHEWAGAALKQHEEALSLVEILKRLLREVLPLESLAALAIFFERRDDLADARRALLVKAVAYVG